MIKTLDRSTLRLIGTRIDAALAPLAKELGISIKYNGGSFVSQNATLKLAVAVLDATGAAVTKEASDFKFYAARFGLKPDDLGREFSVGNDKRFKIAGLKPRRGSYPILAARVSDGRMFKFSARQVRAALDPVPTDPAAAAALALALADAIADDGSDE